MCRSISCLSVALAFILTIPTFAGRALALPPNVATSAELRAAFAAAKPGTTITLAPGAYALDAPLATTVDGTMAAPIKLTSNKADGVRLDFSSADGLVVANAYWIFDAIWLNGTCANCESTGIRVRPMASHLSVHGSRFTNFAFGIRGERTQEAEPADILVDTNEFLNPRLAAGGTPLDLFGGKRWHIIGNYLHDYTGAQKHAGISVSGGASDALIERNLIVGNKDQPAGGTSVGFSLGGADTTPASCAADNRGAASCICEVLAGRVHNNIVVRTTGHGTLISRACGTAVLLNTLYLTTPGLEVVAPGPTGTLVVKFNVMSGAMTGAMATLNKVGVGGPALKMYYKDPDNLDFSTGAADGPINDLQPAIPEVKDDYLGDLRNRTLDWGAVELKVGTRATWPWPGTALIGAGMGPAGGTGSPPSDAGLVPVDAQTADAGQSADGRNPVTNADSGAQGAGGSGTGGTNVGMGGSGVSGSGAGGAGQVATGDGGSNRNAGNSSDGGCACRLASHSPRSISGAMLLVLGIVATYERRRRRAILLASQGG